MVMTKELEKYFIKVFEETNASGAKFKELSKNKQKKYLRYMFYRYRRDMSDRARETQRFITTDENGKQYNSFRIMNRKIARNMARKKAGGNKGLRYEFEQIFYPIKNGVKNGN